MEPVAPQGTSGPDLMGQPVSHQGISGATDGLCGGGSLPLRALGGSLSLSARLARLQKLVCLFTILPGVSGVIPSALSAASATVWRAQAFEIKDMEVDRSNRGLERVGSGSGGGEEMVLAWRLQAPLLSAVLSLCSLWNSAVNPLCEIRSPPLGADPAAVRPL
uniref:Uncharacterized protein n=1 Tax=Knipowitschia caucasica TaxID=637954 RepID=A0AAV2IYJ9_KNICA